LIEVKLISNFYYNKRRRLAGERLDFHFPMFAQQCISFVFDGAQKKLKPFADKGFVILGGLFRGQNM